MNNDYEEIHKIAQIKRVYIATLIYNYKVCRVKSDFYVKLKRNEVEQYERFIENNVSYLEYFIEK